MHRIRRAISWQAALLILAGGLVTTSVFASDSNYADRPEARSMVKKLVAKGLDGNHVRALLADAKRQDSILEAIARPAESTLNWARYKKIFIQPDRVAQGVEFARAHSETLQRAEEQYGVPAAVIVAILGVETRYGRNTGSYRALDALATLGFDYPPRGAFFRKQLAALFELEQQAHIDPAKVTGSYAGAVGYPQFIPTSYQAYAVDFDGDGRTDLIGSAADAIGSVANYFHQHHWQRGLPIAARAHVQGSAYKALAKKGYKPTFDLDQAHQNGVVEVRCQHDSPGTDFCFDLANDTPVALLDLQGEQGHEFWLVTDNFYVITRYNHSDLYAMAVTQLSAQLSHALKDGVQ